MNIIFGNKRKLTAWLIGIAAALLLIFLAVKNADAVLSVLSWCTDVTAPLLIGWAIALIVNVPMRFFEEHLWRGSNNKILCRARRPVASILSFVLIIGALVGVVVIVLPTLVDTMAVIVESAIELVGRFNAMTEAEIAELPMGQLLLDIDWNHLLDSLTTWLKDSANTIVNTVFGTVTSFVGSIIDLFVSVAFAVYILFSKETLKRQANKVVKVWFPGKGGEWLCHAASVANTTFRNFVAGQTIEALILAALCFVGMLIFGFPYPAMISTMVGVTAFVPVIGGFIGGGVGAFMILTSSPIKALWFIVYLIVLQQLEGNIIYPRVMGNKVNLSAIWILAAVTVGGGIGGPIGMLLGVPIVSTAYVLFKEETEKRARAAAADSEIPEAMPSVQESSEAALAEQENPTPQQKTKKTKQKSAQKSKSPKKTVKQAK